MGSGHVGIAWLIAVAAIGELPWPVVAGDSLLATTRSASNPAPPGMGRRRAGPPHAPDYGIFKEYGPGTLSAMSGDHRPPPEIKFGTGDVGGVSFFEAAAGGLFIPAEASVRPGNLTLAESANRCQGMLSVPYARLALPPARRCAG